MRKKLIIPLLLLTSFAYAQYAPRRINRSVPAGAIPGLVNFNGAPSTETNAVGARISGSITCVANAYCTHTVEPTVSGDGIVVFYTYKSANTTAQVPTVTDDKSGGSSTYTCASEANDAHGSSRTFVGACYTLSATANIRNITITFPVATNTQVAAAVGVFYNINDVDVSHANGTQTGSTTWSAGAMSTTVDNDLICEVAVGTTTRTDITAFTAGSYGLTLLPNQTTQMQLADRRDAMAVQCGYWTSHGSITPTITGQSNAYAALGISFKSGTSGTAPSGMYIAHMYHMTTSTAASGTQNLQVPTQGNLLVVPAQGSGSGTYISAISDGTNTYTECPRSQDHSNLAMMWYAQNFSPGLTPLSFTMSNTGDIGPLFAYDIVGAATSQTCNMAVETTLPSTASTNSLNILNGWAPGATSGIAIVTSGQPTNTTIGITSPSGAVLDVSTVGSENLDGPYPVDQNNGGFHRSFSNNTAGSWAATFTQNFNINNTSAWVAAAGFQAPGASLRPTIVNHNFYENSASASTIAVSITPIAGHALIVALGNNSSQTITKVCTDGGTCAAGNSFTHAVAGTTSLCSSGTLRGDIWYLISAPSSVTAVTATYSGNAVNREVGIWEVANLTNIDASNNNAFTVGTPTANAATGATVTTTASDGFIAAIAEISSSISGIYSGNEFIGPFNVFSITTDASASMSSSSATTHTPVWAASSGTGCSSVAAFK